MALPVLFSPEAIVEHFAGAGIHLSERELRATARRLGACRQIGKALFLTEKDLDRVIAAAAVAPEEGEDSVWQGSTGAAASGTILSPSPESAFARARERLTANSRQPKQPATKRGCVVPLSTAKKPN